MGVERIPKKLFAMELRMLATRRFASLFAITLAAVVLTSCADDHTPPTAPVVQVAPDPSLIGDVLGGVTGTVGGLANQLGLVSCNVRTTHTASEEIGPEGGILWVGPHRLYVPPKALRERVRISAIAPRGNYVQVQFEPAGLEFHRPTLLSLSYRDCSLFSPWRLRVVYVDDTLEILEVLPTLTSILTRTANAPVDHFSRYMLAD
jgi:hypothetical protein